MNYRISLLPLFFLALTMAPHNSIGGYSLSKKIVGPGNASSVIRIGPNLFCIAGYDNVLSHILITDTSANILKSASFGGFEKCYDICTFSGNSYLITGDKMSKTYLRAMDSSLNTIWYREYFPGWGTKIEQKSSTQYYFAATEVDTISHGYHGYFAETDSTGNVTRHHIVSIDTFTSLYDATRLKNGDYLLVGCSDSLRTSLGRMFVERIDSNLVRRWSHTYTFFPPQISDTVLKSTAFSAIEDSDGCIYLSCVLLKGSYGRIPAAVRIDSIGTILNVSCFPTPYFCIVNELPIEYKYQIERLGDKTMVIPYGCLGSLTVIHTDNVLSMLEWMKPKDDTSYSSYITESAPISSNKILYTGNTFSDGYAANSEIFIAILSYSASSIQVNTRKSLSFSKPVIKKIFQGNHLVIKQGDNVFDIQGRKYPSAKSYNESFSRITR